MAERVWDRFLTEEDKAHLAQGRQRTVNFGSKPAFLMIDLYRGVFGDEPMPLMEGIKTWSGYCGMSGWDALPKIQELLATSRSIGIPVIHVTGLGDESGMLGWNEAAHRDYSTPEPTDPAAIDRAARRFDIVTELTPIKGEVVLKKTAPSAFFGTPLAVQLTYLGIDTLIVAGESTSGCVRASVVEGCASRFRMQVVEECVFDRHQTAHAMNLFDMNQKYADVIPLERALSYLEDYSAG